MANCEQWREALSAYADGECAAPERATVEAHLRACADCRAWLEQITADQDRFTRTFTTPQTDLSTSVLRRVREMSNEEKWVLPPALAPPRRQPSFSWVGAFLVLALFGMIAAVLFPVFARARAKASQNNCLSNVKQCGLGMIMYASDHKDHLPSAATWVQDTLPYLKNVQIYMCPNDTSGEQVSYAMNPHLSGAALGSIENPAETVMVYDAEHGVPAYRHNDGLNVCFADGHVKWLHRLPPEVTGTTAVMPAPNRDYGLGRKIELAYDAACEVWVAHLQDSVITAERAFYEHGGFVLTSNLTVSPTDGSGRRAEITGKVPQSEVGNTLNALAALGYVARREITGQDLTDQYTAQLRATEQAEQAGLTAEEKQAQAPAAQRPNLEPTREAARQKLGQAQDALFGTQRQLALSTVSATLLERGATAPAAAGGLTAAWQSFLRAATTVGVALVWVGLYGLLAVPLLVGVVLWRRRKRG